MARTLAPARTGSKDGGLNRGRFLVATGGVR